MAFNTTSTSTKNQFVSRLVSKKTGATVSWINITDDFARKVMGASKASEVTATEAEDILPMIMNNDFVEVQITDLTAQVDIIPATDY